MGIFGNFVHLCVCIIDFSSIEMHSLHQLQRHLKSIGLERKVHTDSTESSLFWQMYKGNTD